MTNIEMGEPGGSEPSALTLSAVLERAASQLRLPKKGGEETRIGGYWAVLADEYPMSDVHSLWKADLMGVAVQALTRTTKGPVYAIPFGWAQRNDDGSRTDYFVGVDLVNSDGASCYVGFQHVPSWVTGTLFASPSAASTKENP